MSGSVSVDRPRCSFSFFRDRSGKSCLMHRCVNVIPTMPGMPPFQCEAPAEHPGGMCDECAMLTASLAMENAHLIGHHSFPIAMCPHGLMLEGTLYVAHRHGNNLLDDLI